MKTNYSDIIDTITKLTRSWHREILTQYGGGQSTACTTGPKKTADDTIDFLDCDCTCVATPLWWDENGTPRFEVHHPDLSPDIYADEVVLLRIACQSCHHEFSVQIALNTMDRVRASVMNGSHGKPIKLLEEALVLAGASTAPPNGFARLLEIADEAKEIREQKLRAMADDVREGKIHYGDPPNIGCCLAGPTMNCLDLRVLEFWRRDPIGSSFVRVAELEIELPDATDPEFAR